MVPSLQMKQRQRSIRLTPWVSGGCRVQPRSSDSELMLLTLSRWAASGAALAGEDAGLGGGEEGSLVASAHEIPTPCRTQVFLGDPLGHLTGPGQLLGKHGFLSRWDSQQDIKDSGLALPPTVCVPLGSHGTAQILSVLLCGMRTIKPANPIDQAVPEDELYNPEAFKGVKTAVTMGQCRCPPVLSGQACLSPSGLKD